MLVEAGSCDRGERGRILAITRQGRVATAATGLVHAVAPYDQQPIQRTGDAHLCTWLAETAVSAAHLLKLCRLLGVDEDLDDSFAMPKDTHAPVAAEIAALTDRWHEAKVDRMGVGSLDRDEARLIEKRLSLGRGETFA